MHIIVHSNVRQKFIFTKLELESKIAVKINVDAK